MALTNTNITIAADQACISLGRHLAKLLPFAHSLTAEAKSGGSAVKVPVYSATAAEFDATDNNYAQTTGVAAVDVTLSKHPVAGFSATDVELMGADVSFVTDAGIAAGIAISKYCESVFMGLPNSGVTGIQTATLASTKGGFTGLLATADAKDIDPGNAVLVLSPAYYSALLAAAGDVNVIGTDALATGIFKGGFAGFSQIERSSQLADGVVGFIAERGAMAFAMRAIEEPIKGSYPQFGTRQDITTGAPVTIMQFVDLVSGAAHVTCTCQFGAEIVDPAHVVYLTAPAG